LRRSNVLPNARLGGQPLKVYTTAVCRPAASGSRAALPNGLVATARELEEAREQGMQAGYAEGLRAGEAQGYARGLEEGQSQGRAEEQARLRDESEALERILAEVLGERARLLASAGQVLAQLVTEIAGRVIRRAVSMDEEVAMRVIRDSLRYIEGAQEVVVRVNPRDADLVRGRIDEVRAALGQDAHLELRSDPAVAPGGCIMDTPQLRFDATLEGLLARYEQALTSWADNQLVEPEPAAETPSGQEAPEEEGQDDAA
jgi:flagellar assembly protein FliH